MTRGKAFNEDEFRNPSAIFRSMPFWGWNTKLDKKELLSQIDIMKKMGFGGFYIHSRCGLADEYLGERFMSLVRLCAQKAKQENMFCGLYDEDRWPSGFAGGLVTRKPQNRQKFLLFTKKRIKAYEKDYAEMNGLPYLFACYDVELDSDGFLKEYNQTHEEDAVWYAYIKTPEPFSWYNGFTYSDIMNEETVDEFIDITYGKYKKMVSDFYGDCILTMFTDEPQVFARETLVDSFGSESATLPWTRDFEKHFKNETGINLAEKLPEMFFEKKGGGSFKIRYEFTKFISNRYADVFIKRSSQRCKSDGLMFTGHLMNEPNLEDQAASIGEAMNAYGIFDIPGVDMLCDLTEFNAVKQVVSSAHQKGVKTVMSEMFGVTNWDYEFRDFKFQNDWQAVLGINMRVPSNTVWVSMNGRSKRDYPGTFGYQSPWHTEYSYLEEHCARLSVITSHGEPVVRVGVIHPIETYWMHYGPQDKTASRRKELETCFESITKTLLYASIDFDFISESQLPKLYKTGEKFNVGCMSYDVVVVPECDTLRKTTVDSLFEFVQNGGRVIFVSECPKFLDGDRSDYCDRLYSASKKVNSNGIKLVDLLQKYSLVTITDDRHNRCDGLICSVRKDETTLWVIIAHGEKIRQKSHSDPKNIIITVKGEFYPYIYDTFTGENSEVEYRFSRGNTEIKYTLFSHDSLVIRLMPEKREKNYCAAENGWVLKKTIDFKQNVEYELKEENVCLLDIAEYSFDGIEYFELEEIRKIDEKCREHFFGIQRDFTQVYAIEKSKTHKVYLRFEVFSEENLPDVMFGAEEVCELKINGRTIELNESGYYTDKCIKKYPVCGIKKGRNIFDIAIPFSKRNSIENVFLLGNFGVRLTGIKKTLTKIPTEIGFSSITNQLMPFYGGSVVYKSEITTPECYIKIRVSNFRAPVIKVLIDGRFSGYIAFDPYVLKSDMLAEGKHTVEFVAYGNRYNSFAGLHNTTNSDFFSPLYWLTDGDNWSYEYVLRDFGILASPIIEVYTKEE